MGNHKARPRRRTVEDAFQDWWVKNFSPALFPTSREGNIAHGFARAAWFKGYALAKRRQRRGS